MRKMSAPTSTELIYVDEPAEGTLKFGVQGPRSKQLQADLIVLGYLPASADDGLFGPGTAGGVRRFQEASELVVDGVAGPLSLAAVASATHAIRELQHELKVQRDGLNDTLRRAGGVCNAANFGGRAERHLVALNAERERLDAVARVARVMCDAATREAEMNVMREYEPELKTLKAQRDSAFMDGAKSVAFDDENWRAVPFARALLGKWRDTLAVRRAWEGMVDELSVEVIEEAIGEDHRHRRTDESGQLIRRFESETAADHG